MTTRREAVLEKLTDSTALMAIATGGVHDSESAGREGMQRELLVADGQVAVSPGVYVMWSSEVPFGINQRELMAQRVFFEVYFYQDNGFEIIRQMRGIVRGLLEYQPVQYDEPDTMWMVDIFWRGDVLTQYDDEMGGVCFERTRYEILEKRKPS